MRDQVEQHPRIDASLVRWSGLLERPWRSPSVNGGEEPDAWRALRQSSEATYWEGAAPWATYRVTASTPWLVDGGEEGVLDVEFVADQATVFGKPGDTWTVRFKLASTPAHFGGRRWWLVCPTCRHRRAHLYPVAPGVPWICRECLGLTYKSRQEMGRSARHGNGWGAVNHALDSALRRIAARGRRAYRRARYREKGRVLDEPRPDSHSSGCTMPDRSQGGTTALDAT